MPAFVLERAVPPAFDITDPDQIALHSRWAADAYKAAGIVWLGSVATQARMYGLCVADQRSDVETYLRAIGVAESDYTLSEVVSALGPQYAMSRDDPRYRPQRT